jgi:hypothetical protein
MRHIDAVARRVGKSVLSSTGPDIRPAVESNLILNHTERVASF